ncbi:MAG: ImmA/IrrE family metallo-endopeptidase [Bacteroidota bacterium]|nr:ImmA/IrrE family metallo-endopeptidase [Bacteroidota bacterium]
MKTTIIKKADVFNPITNFNTVGQELEEILELHQKDKNLLLKKLNWTDYTSIKKIKKNEFFIIDEYCSIDDGISSYLKEFQQNYSINFDLADKSYKKSLQLFRHLKGAIPLLYNEFNDGIDLLEDITDFFGLDSEEEVIEASKESASMFRSTNKDISVDEINLKAWLRRGEIEFSKLKLGPYNKELLLNWVNEKDWINHIQDVGYYKDLPNIFRTFGVALVYVQYLPKTVYGAIRWMDGIPLIQISDRNTDLATCWFTLFHEIGHVILHENDTIFEGDINQTKSLKNKKECDANKFANSYLFNGDDLRKYVFSLPNSSTVTSTELSKMYNVDILFTSYWLLKAQKNPQFQKKIPIKFS